MTAEIVLQQAPLEHATKQPFGLRYAVFCNDVLRGIPREECPSLSKLGHIGDYENYRKARITALEYPHPALIKFYPDFETRQPSQDFLKDLEKTD